MSWKRRLKDTAILVLVFIAAMIGFSYYTNKGNDNMTADMGSATYPQISFSYNGYSVNILSGYARVMDISTMRDTITPVSGGRVEGMIYAYDNKISKAVYSVYTPDGREKLKEGKLDWTGENFTVDLNGVSITGVEQILEIVLDTGNDRSVYFYTRITDAVNADLAQCLDYIRDFHVNAMGKAEGVGIGTVLEPGPESDNTTLQHVTIHSDYDHVSWGELEPMVEKGERWSIKEINDGSVSVLLDYRVRCRGEENDTDEYQVREFFRVTHAAEAQKTYLLDYDRTMEQVFDVTKHVLGGAGVVLGIAPEDVPYLVNDEGNAVSFVVANELWNYNKKTDEMALVFSFADVENTDVRNMVPHHKIKLLAVDKEDGVTFAVCGYMSRGAHEGEVGAAVYYYDVKKNSVEEKVFISSNRSYGNAIHELSSMIYHSTGRNKLYVMPGGMLYEYDTKSNKSKELAKKLKKGQYVISGDGRLAAWQDGDNLDSASRIVVMDFETGEERTVECGEDECIRPLGFIKDDFVYGVAKKADTGRTVSGEAAVPMYKVEIQNKKSKIVKTYQAEGVYVLSVLFDETMVTLNRVVKEGETYSSVAPDYITNNGGKEECNISVESYVTDLKETQVRLAYNDGISDRQPKVLKPKQILFEDPETLNFDELDRGEQYYVYGYGELAGIFEHAGEAIRKAEEYGGNVVDARQSYIWEKGNRSRQHLITGKDDLIQNMVDRLRQGEAPTDIVKDLNNERCLNLTGCTVDELKYLLDRDIPVIGMLNAQNAVILVGYTEKSAIYINVDSAERRTVPVGELEQMTSGSGYTYIG